MFLVNLNPMADLPENHYQAGFAPGDNGTLFVTRLQR
jgi:hypothetical protein